MKNFDSLLHSLYMFNCAGGPENLDNNTLQKIQQSLETQNDIPAILMGMLSYLVLNPPQYYWNREVMVEISNQLADWYKFNEHLLVEAFQSAQEYFFAAINSYNNLIEIYNELNEVSYEISLKTKIYRNPFYTQIAEDCLVNFYRCIRDIITKIDGTKDYSSQNMLSNLIEVMGKFRFSKAIAIDIDIRNAINHGNVSVNGNEIFFKYKPGSGKTARFEVKTLKVWEYDDLINSTLDIASGILVGFLKFMVITPDFLDKFLSPQTEATDTEETDFEWLKLIYRTHHTKLLFFKKGMVGSTQLSLHVQTSIDDKTRLIFSLLELLKVIYLTFPGYERYLIGYEHSRSPNGFIRLCQTDLAEGNSDNAQLLEKALKKHDILVWNIQNEIIDDRHYKFHLFPKIQGTNWLVTQIKDCSIEGYKRIKARLIFKHPLLRNEVIEISHQVVEQLKCLETPQNPFENVPFGKITADMIFLELFYESYQRQTFTLFPDNPDFIALVHYYGQPQAPKLKHGGIPEQLWNQFSKEIFDKMEFAWNPNFKGA